MKDNEEIVGKFTVVKFRNNPATHSRNKLISTTLNKYCVIDYDYLSENNAVTPLPNEFWLVQIMHETRVGQREGIIVCRPQVHLTRKHVLTLLDGMFTQKIEDGVLYAYPKYPQFYWILPMNYRKSFPREEAHAFVTVNTPHAISENIDYPPGYPNEAARRVIYANGPDSRTANPNALPPAAHPF